MIICKEIKIKLEGHKQISASLCTDNIESPTKYRWDSVNCPDCVGMKSKLEEKAKEQSKKWKEENL